MTLTDLMAQLPAPDAPHTCEAGDLVHSCYVGQWTLHGPHDVRLRSGNVMHCPGKDRETVLCSSRQCEIVVWQASGTHRREATMTSTRDLTTGTFVRHFGKAYEVTSKATEGDSLVISLYRDYDMTEDTVVVPVVDQDDVHWHTY